VWIKYICSWLLYGTPFVLLEHFLVKKENWIGKYITNIKCAFLMTTGGIILVAEFAAQCYYTKGK